jgi:uncharacterized membrane protein
MKWICRSDGRWLLPNIGALLFLGIVSSWLASSSFWVHFATAALLAIALGLNIARRASHPKGWASFISLGPAFFGVPLALFGMQHFTEMSVVVGGVPSWMPGHTFWVCFVGIALIAAALSLITEIKHHLAALLAGIMLFLFVLLIYVPAAVGNPYDRFEVALLFRDLALSGGALALASTPLAERRPNFAWLAVVARFFFAVPMLFFGVEHFRHPQFAPGVPLEKLMPPWIPGPMAWAYLTGTILVVCGLCLVFNKGTRVASASLGVAYLVLVICIYMPMEIVHPSIEISGELDYVADTLAVAGAALLIAGAHTRSAATEGMPNWSNSLT